MLAATLDTDLLTNMLAGKAKIHEQGIVWDGEGAVRAG